MCTAHMAPRRAARFSCSGQTAPPRRTPISAISCWPSLRAVKRAVERKVLEANTIGATAVGLSWQQGPLSTGAIGRFLVPEPLPTRLLYVEPLRRRMRVRFGGTWLADSEHALVFFEPGRYPVAYFPESDIFPEALQRIDHTTQHPELGRTTWYTVRAG